MSESLVAAGATYQSAERALTLLHAEVGKHLPPETNEAAKEQLAKRQTSAAVALLRMGQDERVWPLLKHRPDPRMRSYLIHRLSPSFCHGGPRNGITVTVHLIFHVDQLNTLSP